MEQTPTGPSVTVLFPTRFISADDLKGKEWTLVISHWTVESVYNVREGKESEQLVLYFEGRKKGLLLKKRNARIIKRLYGDNIAAWVGKAVTLYPSEEKAFGDLIGVVRVKLERPRDLPQPPAAPNGHVENEQG